MSAEWALDMAAVKGSREGRLTTQARARDASRHPSPSDDGAARPAASFGFAFGCSHSRARLAHDRGELIRPLA